MRGGGSLARRRSIAASVDAPDPLSAAQAEVVALRAEAATLRAEAATLRADLIAARAEGVTLRAEVAALRAATAPPLPASTASPHCPAPLISLGVLHSIFTGLATPPPDASHTLEERLFAHLTRALGGSRADVALHAGAVVRALPHFAAVDERCALLLAALRCEVDDGILASALRLREAAGDALAAHLSHEGGGGSALAARIASSAPPLVESEWRAVLASLFSPRDAAEAGARLEAAVLHAAVATALGVVVNTRPESPEDADAEAAAVAAVAAAAAGMTRQEARVVINRSNAPCAVPWATLLKELTLMHLQRQQRFLGAFLGAWRKRDAARTGALPRGALLEMLGAGGASYEALLPAGERVTLSAALAAVVGRAQAGAGGA